CLAGLRTRLIDIRTDLGQLQIARRMTARSQNRFGALVVSSARDARPDDGQYRSFSFFRRTTMSAKLYQFAEEKAKRLALRTNTDPFGGGHDGHAGSSTNRRAPARGTAAARTHVEGTRP